MANATAFYAVRVNEPLTMHFGVCQLSEDLSILLLLQNVNQTPRLFLILHLSKGKTIDFLPYKGTWTNNLHKVWLHGWVNFQSIYYRCLWCTRIDHHNTYHCDFALPNIQTYLRVPNIFPNLVKFYPLLTYTFAYRKHSFSL